MVRTLAVVGDSSATTRKRLLTSPVHNSRDRSESGGNTAHNTLTVARTTKGMARNQGLVDQEEGLGNGVHLGHGNTQAFPPNWGIVKLGDTPARFGQL